MYSSFSLLKVGPTSLQKGHMKSAISIIVTGALSGPLLGARTGSKLTVSADMAAGTENRDATANSTVRMTSLLMVATPFRLVVKVKGL